MTKKYKLTSETKEWCGITLHRIEYLKDFADVEKGKKGGWVEKEENLSQEGNARVSGNAWVYGLLFCSYLWCLRLFLNPSASH